MKVETLLQKLSSGVSEIITEQELSNIIYSDNKRAYVGFEPSGKGHLGWLILANKIKDLESCGFTVDILLADVHAKINDKLGGDEDKIREAGNYIIETFKSLGVKSRYYWASNFISTTNYTRTLLSVCKSVNPARIRRAMEIMGRSGDDESLDFAKMLYPAMQVSDIFANDWRVCLGGMDQRHAHMLARDVAKQLGWTPPVAIHTPLIPSLNGAGRMNPVNKMGKSNVEGSIFLSDSEEEIRRKIINSLFPPKDVDNAVVSIAKNILFQNNEYVMRIERPSKYGGDVEVKSAEELFDLIQSGSLHPFDVKSVVSRDLIDILSIFG